VQRQVLYLGEINGQSARVVQRTIEIFEEGRILPRTVSLFAEERYETISDESIVRIRLKEMQLRRPRQWGACWLSCYLYEQLKLDNFGRSEWRNPKRDAVGFSIAAASELSSDRTR